MRPPKTERTHLLIERVGRGVVVRARVCCVLLLLLLRFACALPRVFAGAVCARARAVVATRAPARAIEPAAQPPLDTSGTNAHCLKG